MTERRLTLDALSQLIDSARRKLKGSRVATLIRPIGPTKDKRAPDLQRWSMPA